MKPKQFVVLSSIVATATGVAAFLAFSSLGTGDALAQGRATFDVVFSRQFVLTDANGRFRGEMHVDQRGPVEIVLYDSRTNPSLRIGVGADGNGWIVDASGRSLLATHMQGPQGLPPTQRVSPPGRGLGKADAADQADVEAVQAQVDALWRQMRILLERVDLLSRGR